jgi:hypothetical protein
VPRLVAAIALVLALVVLARVRMHGQDPGQARTVLYPYSLSAIDQGLMSDQPPRMLHSRTASYVPGRLIVKFRDGTSSAVRLNSLSRLSTASTAGAVSERPSYANFDVIRIDPAADAEAAADAMRQQPEVEYAQPAYRVHKMFVPNDSVYQCSPATPTRGCQWNFPLIDVERAWDIQPAAGSSIVVAVLDSGMAFESKVIRFRGQQFLDDSGVLHPALGTVDIPFAAAPDLFTAGRFVAPHDFIWEDNDPVDLDSHGTHVSGTIGELSNNSLAAAGIAFNVKLMPVKVIDSDWDDIFGSPNVGTDDTVARGLRYAADNGAKVINMSIGRTGPPAPVLEDAIKYAVGKGAFIAISAGNDFGDGNPTEVVAEIASRVPGAVSVGAVDRSSNHAFYSSTGSWVELAAPGGAFDGFGGAGLIFQQTVDLRFGLCLAEPRGCATPVSFDPPRFDVFGIFGFEGTSMSAPHVSGLAALLMQQGITSPAAVEAAMERFAKDLGAPGRDNLYGYGLIQARDTLRGLGLAR